MTGERDMTTRLLVDTDRIKGIDLHFQGVPGVIVSWLVKEETGWVLIDCGPGSTVDNLEAGVAAAGIDMAEVERVVLTHIHLDHAGGTGLLLQRHPHLRVSVHDGAAPFVVNPERLLASAARSYGDQMDTLWGETIGAPEDAIEQIADGELVPGTSLRAIESPGHAGTHIAYLDEASGTLFTGDVAHGRLAGSDVIVPTLSPIELDFGAWAESVSRLQALQPTALALPHGGLFTDASDHLNRIMDRIWHRIAIADKVLQSPDHVDDLAVALLSATRDEFVQEGGDVEAKLATMELCMPSFLGAQGIARWFKVTNRYAQNGAAS